MAAGSHVPEVQRTWRKKTILDCVSMFSVTQLVVHHIVAYHIIPYNTIHHAMPYHTTPDHAMPRHALLYRRNPSYTSTYHKKTKTEEILGRPNAWTNVYRRACGYQRYSCTGRGGEGRGERERERDILSFGTSNKNAPEPKTLDPPRCNVYPTGRLSPPTVFSTAGASRSRTSLLKSSRYFSVLGHQRTHLYGV